MVIITASAGAGGSIAPTGEVVIESGTDQLFTFTPDSGYEVDEVLVGGSAVTPDNNTYEMTNVTTDTTIAVSFKQTPVVKYTITATAGAGGSISPSGAVEVDAGADVKFTITPNAGFGVEDVLVDSVSVGAVTEYTFEGVSDDGTISVSFEELPVVKFTITATAGENGSITPSGEVEVVEGENQKFTFTPDEGYKVGDVLVNDVSIGAKKSYTFVGVDDDGTIEVLFVELPNVANVDVIHDVFGASRVDVLHFSGKYPIGGVPIGIKDGIVFFNKNLWGYTHLGLVVIIGYGGELEDGTDLEGLSALVIYR